MKISSLKSLAKNVLPTNLHAKIRQPLKSKSNINLEWQLVSGVKIRLKDTSNWYMYNDIFVDGEYDIPIQQSLHFQHDKHLNIIDIGANVGFFTLRFIDLLRRTTFPDRQYSITLVEGSPKLCEELNSRLLEDNCLADRIKIINGLIGEREGFGRISELEFNAMNTIFGDDPNAAVVKYVDLHKIIDDKTVIHLLKCDIEGAEQLFLENYSSFMERVQAAVFEFHPNQCDVNKCLDLIRNAGLIHSKQLRVTDAFEVIYFWR